MLNEPLQVEAAPAARGAAERLAAFERDGFVVVPDALLPDEVAELESLVDEAWDRHRAGVRDASFLHSFAFVYEHPSFTRLVDLRTTFPLVVDVLGWNICVYHSHLDVNAPLPTEAATGELPWHRDGGQMNEDAATVPQPRLSVKVSFWLTDVTTTDRGGLHAIPGSHLTAAVPDAGERGEQVLVPPGAAVVFDRRILHARGFNTSDVTRKALFIGYAHRWLRVRDDVRVDGPVAPLNPVQRQLLLPPPRAVSAYVPPPEDVPLRQLVAGNGKESASER